MIKLPIFEALSKQIQHHYNWLPLEVNKGVHTFGLDSTLLNLEVCSFTSIHLKVPTRSVKNLKIQ
jgi:hypothetical protein